MLEFQEIEPKSFELQSEAIYDYELFNVVSVPVGEKVGLTYYSQIDPRWKDILYTSTGNTNQTIGSSGCGPASAAMVVTSIKGIITPPEMADLYVKHRI